MNERVLSPSRLLAIFALIFVGVGFAVTAFVGVLQFTLLFDPTMETPEAAQVYALITSSTPLVDAALYWLTYHLVLSQKIWQAWAVFFFAFGFFAIWAWSVARFQVNMRLSSNLKSHQQTFRAEHELRVEAEQKLLGMDNNIIGAYEQSAEGFFLIDKETAVRHVNDAAAKLLDTLLDDAKTYVGTPLQHILPTLVETDVISALQRCLKQQEPFQDEVHLQDKDVWLSVRIFPAFQGAFVLMKDMTDRKRPSQLADVSEPLLRQTVAHAPFPMAVVDKEWSYLMVSTPWQKQFKLNEKDLEGKSHTQLVPGFPATLNAVTAQLDRGETVQAKEEMVRLGGAEEWLDWEIQPWRNQHDDIAGYLMFAEIVTDTVEAKQKLKNERAQEQMLAYHDALTGLPNRQLFHDRLNMALAQAYRELGRVALMFLDLDGFKAVNDNLGHDAGDMLLKQVAGRLQECIRQTDTAARLGGDEFTLVLAGVKNKEDVDMLAQKVIKLVSDPYDLGGQVARISTSIGISLYPDNTNSAADMIKQADEAMYEAKKSGKNTYRYAQVENKQKPTESA